MSYLDLRIFELSFDATLVFAYHRVVRTRVGAMCGALVVRRWVDHTTFLLRNELVV